MRFLVYVVNLIVAIFLWWLLSRFLSRIFGTSQLDGRTSTRRPSRDNPAPMTHGEMARDPVCGMFVSTELSHPLRTRGRTLHFCSRACLEQYQKKLKSA